MFDGVPFGRFGNVSLLFLDQRGVLDNYLDALVLVLHLVCPLIGPVVDTELQVVVVKDFVRMRFFAGGRQSGRVDKRASQRFRIF